MFARNQATTLTPPSTAGGGETIYIRANELADSVFPRGHRWVGSGRHVLLFSNTGNLELLNPGGNLVWESATSRLEPATLTMKLDGNLAMCDWRGYPVWSTRTNSNPGAYLALQRDGNVVLYSAEGQPLWETGTAGR